MQLAFSGSGSSYSLDLDPNSCSQMLTTTSLSLGLKEVEKDRSDYNIVHLKSSQAETKIHQHTDGRKAKALCMKALCSTPHPCNAGTCFQSASGPGKVSKFATAIGLSKTTESSGACRRKKPGVCIRKIDFSILILASNAVDPT